MLTGTPVLRVTVGVGEVERIPEVKKTERSRAWRASRVFLGHSRQSLDWGGVLVEGGPIEGGGKQIRVNDGSGEEE